MSICVKDEIRIYIYIYVYTHTLRKEATPVSSDCLTVADRGHTLSLSLINCKYSKYYGYIDFQHLSLTAAISLT